ncbi:hypothetical protein ElyMa_006772300 [Elysia marginata]|uniref:DUF547 domain-containing protein n=1 Tax=Elysia marginata TaxID=1093978 RepID=A0AAV4J3G6_9GAST|nr:hypothetical protein ElyMa_006772300 [Elysia marginata]
MLSPARPTSLLLPLFAYFLETSTDTLVFLTSESLKLTKMASIDDVQVMNKGNLTEVKPIPAVELSRKLQKTLLKLKGKFMSDDGKAVDYVGMKKSSEFADYLKEALELQRVDLSNLNEKEKKVFFINVYNSLTIHGLLEQPKLPDSVLSVQQFFRTVGYIIGGLVYSLDDIEHGVLRSNRPHPASIKPMFGPSDPRIKFICKQLDPRIHFAVVCGAKSCPAIGVYTVENVETALDSAARNFCAQEVEMRNEMDEVLLSKLFQWYRADFGETEVDVLKWIMPYLSQAQHDRCSILILKLEKLGPVALRYKDYNWSINQKS